MYIFWSFLSSIKEDQVAPISGMGGNILLMRSSLVVLFHHCDHAHQQEAEDEQQQGKAQQLGRGTASGEGVFFQMYQMAKRDDINILVLLNS